MTVLACHTVYCCYKRLYFTPSENLNSAVHTHTHTRSQCWNRTWEAFPLTVHHHENLLTWQKALWLMTGLSRRLYTGALSYVLHSQIVVTEAFTGTNLTDSRRQGQSYYQVRLLQVHVCNNETHKDGTGDGIQTWIKTLRSSNQEKCFWKSPLYIVFCSHMFTINRVAGALSSQCGMLLPGTQVESFPPLDTSDREDKLWFASKLIVIPRFHWEVSCITIMPWCSCVSCCGPNPLFWQYSSLPAGLTVMHTDCGGMDGNIFPLRKHHKWG